MRLANYLRAQNITLAAFAKRIGRSEATVSRLARGKHLPDWDTMQAIKEATDGCVTPNDFEPTASADNESAA
jgi:transcriptional regulator with XRE-family HTH domain